jgi:hypothetical protein
MHILQVSKIHKGRIETYRAIPAGQVAFTAKPLTLRDKWHPIALLMDCKITAVAKDNRIGVFAVSIIANCTSRVWLVVFICRFAVDGSGGA